MGMFELAPVGISIAIVGLIYIYLARRYIPEAGAGGKADRGVRARERPERSGHH